MGRDKVNNARPRATPTVRPLLAESRHAPSALMFAPWAPSNSRGSCANEKYPAVEIAEAFLVRGKPILIRVCTPFCTPTPDLARAAARKVEDDLAAHRAIGPLAGVPVAIKDLIATKGIRTVGGARAYADFVPDEDDVVVERLAAADAVISGRPTSPSLATGRSDTIRYSRRRATPGRSIAPPAAPAPAPRRR